MHVWRPAETVRARLSSSIRRGLLKDALDPRSAGSEAVCTTPSRVDLGRRRAGFHVESRATDGHQANCSEVLSSSDLLRGDRYALGSPRSRAHFHSWRRRQLVLAPDRAVACSGPPRTFEDVSARFDLRVRRMKQRTTWAARLVIGAVGLSLLFAAALYYLYR